MAVNVLMSASNSSRKNRVLCAIKPYPLAILCSYTQNDHRLESCTLMSEAIYNGLYAASINSLLIRNQKDAVSDEFEALALILRPKHCYTEIRDWRITWQREATMKSSGM